MLVDQCGLYKVLINCIYIIFGLYTLPNLKKHPHVKRTRYAAATGAIEFHVHIIGDDLTSDINCRIYNTVTHNIISV